MKIKYFKDYIELFIKENYITNFHVLSGPYSTSDTDIKLFLSDNLNDFVNAKVMQISKQKRKIGFSLGFISKTELDPEYLEKLPILKMDAIIIDSNGVLLNTINIDIQEDINILTGKTRYRLVPNIDQIKYRYGRDFKMMLRFYSKKLSKNYLESFLYEYDILTPEIYELFKVHGNSIISLNNYEHAMEYIQAHKNELLEKYSKILLDSSYSSNDDILERMYEICLNEPMNSLRIRKSDSNKYYIIEKLVKNISKK